MIRTPTRVVQNRRAMSPYRRSKFAGYMNAKPLSTAPAAAPPAPPRDQANHSEEVFLRNGCQRHGGMVQPRLLLVAQLTTRSSKAALRPANAGGFSEGSPLVQERLMAGRLRQN
jgi:hypothetical protein